MLTELSAMTSADGGPAVAPHVPISRGMCIGVPKETAAGEKRVATVPDVSRQLLMTDPVMSRFMLLGDRELANAYSMNWERVDIARWKATWGEVLKK